MTPFILEAIGTLAAVVILISLAQPTNMRLRVINAIGSVIFVAYGYLLGSFSVWLVNLCCFAVDIYKIMEEQLKLK